LVIKKETCLGQYSNFGLSSP